MSEDPRQEAGSLRVDRLVISVLLLASLAGGLAGGLIGSWVAAEQAADQADNLAVRPPLAVLDLTAAADHWQPQPGVDAATAAARVRAVVAKLVAAGYVVLDSSAVLGAPAEVWVPTDVEVPVAGER